MGLLKKENWVVNGILMVITEGIYVFVLAHLLNLYKKDTWYTNYWYWIGAALCFFVPVLVLFVIFLIQMLCAVAQKLNVPGKEIYGYPYAWIVCMIVPIIGWSLLLVMWLYLMVWIIVMLYRGEGSYYMEEEICKQML